MSQQQYLFKMRLKKQCEMVLEQICHVEKLTNENSSQVEVLEDEFEHQRVLSKITPLSLERIQMVRE